MSDKATLMLAAAKLTEITAGQDENEVKQTMQRFAEMFAFVQKINSKSGPVKMVPIKGL